MKDSTMSRAEKTPNSAQNLKNPVQANAAKSIMTTKINNFFPMIHKFIIFSLKSTTRNSNYSTNLNPNCQKNLLKKTKQKRAQMDSFSLILAY